MKAKIYPAGAPRKGQWVLQTWVPQTIDNGIPAPRFQYFKTAMEAKSAAMFCEFKEKQNTEEFKKGYKLIDRVLKRIAKNRNVELAKEVAIATVQEYENAKDKSEFDLGVLYGAFEHLPDEPPMSFDMNTGSWKL